jgi:alkaline phosphatase
MGFEQVRAAGMFANGSAGTLSFESFPHRGSVTTRRAGGRVTDSAAAATAMATGVKVFKHAVSVALPGDGKPLKTVLERFKDCGRSTGMVTTAIMTHATPAAFAAHDNSRYHYSNIAADYLRDSQPEVLFGGAKYLKADEAARAGYTVVRDREGLKALDTEAATMVSGQFGGDHMPYEFDGLGGLPHLSEMARTALRILDNDPDGFFLIVEGGRIDHAGHDNDIERGVRETVEFSRAVREAMEWAGRRTNTTIIVTADHETGGMKVLLNKGKGNAPDVSWETTGHTGSNVPVYAWGFNAALVNGTVDNTDIFGIMMK